MTGSLEAWVGYLRWLHPLRGEIRPSEFLRVAEITGLATAAEQMQNNYTDRYTVGLIDSDNGVIIHGAQVGAECRY